MRKLDSNAHSVFLLYYHLILVVKYRKKVLNDPISNRAKEIFEHIAPNYHITLEEWNHRLTEWKVKTSKSRLGPHQTASED